MKRRRAFGTPAAAKPRKRRRQGGMTITRSAGTQRIFVPRSLGTPLAITERKYFDSELSAGTGVTNASSWAGTEFDPTTLNTLFVPVTGDDFNNRTGRKVQVLAIKIRGHINIPAQADQTAEDNGAFMRLILVQDRQTNAAQLNAEDVINSGGANVAINMFQNPAFFGRFRVLKDKNIALNTLAAVYDGTNIEQPGIVALQRRFKEIKVEQWQEWQEISISTEEEQ